MVEADPSTYVSDNEEELVKIVKHSKNDFPRALALAALIEYGEGTTTEQVIEQIEQFRDEEG